PDPGLRDGNPRRVLVARSPARADPLSACWRGPRRPSCSTADSDVIRPRGVRFLDYEIELGLVLRREITSPTAVTDANLPDFVAGPVIVNDYSARDVQIPQTQFYKGKSFRTFGPVGPYLCMLGAGDMGALKDVRLTLTVNGEVRQSDSTRNLVYGPAETLTELSGCTTFTPRPHLDRHAGWLRAGDPVAHDAAARRALAGQGELGLLHERAGEAHAVPEGRRRSGGTHQERGRCDRSRRAAQPRGRRLSQWTTVSFATE